MNKEINYNEEFFVKYATLKPAEIVMAIKRIQNCSVEIYSKIDLEPIVKITTNKFSFKYNNEEVYQEMIKIYPDIKNFKSIVVHTKNLSIIYPKFESKPLYQGDLLGSLITTLSLIKSDKYDINEFFGIRICNKQTKATPEEIILIKKAQIIYFLMGLLSDKALQDCLVIYTDFNDDKISQIISSLVLNDQTGQMEEFIKNLPSGYYDTDKEVLKEVTKLWVVN